MPTSALGLYLRDICVPACLTGIGVLFGIGTVWLAHADTGHGHVSAWDVLYGLLLAILTSAFGFTLHYLRRRRLLTTVLKQSAHLHVMDAVEELKRDVISPEHQQFVNLLSTYVRKYHEDLQQVESKRLFYEYFTTRFAHQTKTPLTVLRLLAQELAANTANAASGQAEKSLKEIAVDMNVELAKIETALDTMLYTARLQSFSFDTRMVRIPLAGLLRAVVNEHKSTWIRQRIYPRVEIDEKLLVTSDEKWLRFMCDQIVRNALQYGYRVDSSGRPTDEAAAFIISATQVTNATRIEFRDQGIGMRQRDVRRMFEPFYTGENGRSHSRSTGMGLYLVAEAASRLGVQVSAESTLYEGTVVVLVIPESSFIAPYLD